MSETSAPSPTLVIDASTAVWVVLPVFAGVTVIERVADWRRRRIRLVAPMLWVAECVSAIRRGVHANVIAADEGRTAIDDLFALEVETLPLTLQLSYSAYEWAGRLGQARAYDGFYLAMAEELGAEFWSADRRLVNAVRQLGVAWAHWVGENDGTAVS